MSQELKPCPFCGEEASFESEVECGTNFEYVVCSGCMARSDGYISGMASCAAEEWNTRTLTPKQQCADEMYEMLMHVYENENLFTLSADIDQLLTKARGESCEN